VKRRVVVTGLGSVSPFGKGADVLWKNLAAGESGLKKITLFDASELRNDLAGEVPGYEAPRSSGEATRAERFLLDAVAEAAGTAGLERVPPERKGLVTGTNFGGLAAAEFALCPDIDKEGAGAAGAGGDLSGYLFDGAASHVAAAHDLAGPSSTLSLSCASGAAALALACEAIRAGRADAMLAAAYDELSLFCYAGLSALRAVTTETIRPFDAKRSGTLFGEGAGALVLEEYESARKRGAPILAEVAGAALTNEAFHMTAPEKEGRGIARLMAAALEDAGVAPGEIDHVNCHGTGTKYNDVIETRAVKSVFGEHARKLTLTANKSMLGHTMGAAGLHESIAAIMTIRHDLVPPTVNYRTPDPECDLDCVPNAAREAAVRTVLKTNYGIGGTNAAVVFRRAE